MAGIGIEQFNDFMNTTGVAVLGSAKDVINETQKNTYIYGRMLRGGGMSKTLKGGKKIRDYLMMNEKSTRRHIGVAPELTWENPQTSVYHEIPWRYTIDHISWTDQEIEQNDNTEYMSDDGWFHMFKELKHLKWERLWSSWYNGCEDDTFATPSKANMEDEAGRVPYSIPCFVNEMSNGLYTAAVTGTWTTKAGLSPTSGDANGKWDNVRETYAKDPALLSVGVDWDGFKALSRAVHRTGFQPLPGKGGSFSEPETNPQFIATSIGGITNYEIALRRSNDRLVSAQDPHYAYPQFAGIDLIWVSNLDTAILHPSSDTGGLGTYDGANTTARGARYFGINPKYLFPVLHARYYAKVGKVRNHPNQEGANIQTIQQWHNLFPRSLRRQFCVYPSATLS